MSKRLFTYSSILTAAVCILGLSSNISAQNPLRLCTDDLDSTYPNFN